MAEAHVRKQIRDAYAKALEALEPEHVDAVYRSRQRPIPADIDRALRVYCKDEPEIRTAAFGGGRGRVTLERRLELVIDACVRSTEGDADDLVDAILYQVEVALAGNQGLAGSKYAHPRRLIVEYSSDQEKDLAVGRLVCEVVYLTALNAPHQPL